MSIRKTLEQMAEEKQGNYDLVLDNDKSIKQMMDRFYIIPKGKADITGPERKVLEKHNIKINDEEISKGKDGYIVTRGHRNKVLSKKQVLEIKSDAEHSQKALSKLYNCCVGTINKVKNNKY